jgi:hypothetical protein
MKIKVHELIKELQSCDPDSDITITLDIINEYVQVHVEDCIFWNVSSSKTGQTDIYINEGEE